MDNQWLPQDTKLYLDTLADAGGKQAFRSFTLGLGLCAILGGCALGGPSIVRSGIIGVFAMGVDVLANDPPDPNYTVIAVPVTPTTNQQPILPNGSLTLAQADAFNALYKNE